MLNLDFTEEQDMLREMVRGVCAQYAAARGRPRDGGRPGRLPDRAVDAARRARPARPAAARGVRRCRACRCSRASSSTRSSAGRWRRSPHFVSCVLSAGALLRARVRDEQKAEWLPQIATGEAILTPAWLEPDNGFGPEGVQLRAGRRRRRLRAHRHQVPRALRARRPTGSSCWPAPATAETDVDLFLVDPTRRRRHAHAEDVDQLRHPVPGRLRRRAASPAADRIGAAGTGWATWQQVMDDG